MSRFKTVKTQFVNLSTNVVQKGGLLSDELSTLITALSYPNDWKYRPMHFAKQLGLSRNRAYKAFDGLIEKGFCIRLRMKNGNLASEVDYIFFDEVSLCEQYIKESEKEFSTYFSVDHKLNFKKFLRHVEFRDVEFRDVENGELTKKIANKKDLNKEEEQQQRKPVEPTVSKKPSAPSGPAAPVVVLSSKSKNEGKDTSHTTAEANIVFPSLDMDRCHDLSEDNKKAIFSDCINLNKSDADLSQALDCAYNDGVSLRRSRVAYIRSALKKGFSSPRMEDPSMEQAFKYNERLLSCKNERMKKVGEQNLERIKLGSMRVYEKVPGGYNEQQVSIKMAFKSDWYMHNKILDDMIEENARFNAQKQA